MRQASALLLCWTALTAGRLFGCELLVAAAADLSPLETQLRNSLSDCVIRITFASSGTLARQIRSGAEIDVFLSANRNFVSDLVRDGKADGSTAVVYARGRIALWSKAGLKWEDLSKASRIALANPALAPYGQAAKQALQSRGLWPEVENRIVFGENIRQAWQFAQSGNVDAAIVSWTLAKDAGGHLLPSSWHDPIEQTGIVPKSSRNPGAARRFLEWLISPGGQKLLTGFGLDARQPDGVGRSSH